MASAASTVLATLLQFPSGKPTTVQMVREGKCSWIFFTKEEGTHTEAMWYLSASSHKARMSRQAAVAFKRVWSTWEKMKSLVMEMLLSE